MRSSEDKNVFNVSLQSRKMKREYETNEEKLAVGSKNSSNCQLPTANFSSFILQQLNPRLPPPAHSS